MPMDWMGPRVYPNYWYDVFNNNGERGREAIYAREGVFQWEGWEVGLIFILLGCAVRRQCPRVQHHVHKLRRLLHF